MKEIINEHGVKEYVYETPLEQAKQQTKPVAQPTHTETPKKKSFGMHDFVVILIFFLALVIAFVVGRLVFKLW